MSLFEQLPVPRDPAEVRDSELERLAKTPASIEEVGRVATKLWAELPQADRDIRTAVVSQLFPGDRPGDLEGYQKAMYALLFVQHQVEVAQFAEQFESIFAGDADTDAA
jgi:hypothetical protein